VSARVLIAGIGNIFHGDDAVGTVVATRLAGERLPEGTRVVDFGIRGFDLALALTSGEWDAAVLVDACRRGGPPGSLYVIEPSVESEAATLDGHALDPATVLRVARSLGGELPTLRVVGIEPETLDPDDALSAPVAAAVDGAIALVRSVAAELGACAHA
jgi:hydrogenase maturation protease